MSCLWCFAVVFSLKTLTVTLNVEKQTQTVEWAVCIFVATLVFCTEHWWQYNLFQLICIGRRIKTWLKNAFKLSSCVSSDNILDFLLFNNTVITERNPATILRLGGYTWNDTLALFLLSKVVWKWLVQGGAWNGQDRLWPPGAPIKLPARLLTDPLEGYWVTKHPTTKNSWQHNKISLLILFCLVVIYLWSIKSWSGLGVCTLESWWGLDSILTTALVQL